MGFFVLTQGAPQISVAAELASISPSLADPIPNAIDLVTKRWYIRTTADGCIFL